LNSKLINNFSLIKILKTLYLLFIIYYLSFCIDLIRINQTFICLFNDCKELHGEHAADLTASSLIGALTRFFACRGVPDRIFSDRGTNIKSSSLWFGERQEGEVGDKVNDLLSPLGVSWSLTTTETPHQNILAEAAVKGLKRCLVGFWGRQRLSWDEVTSLFIQFEGIQNSRLLVIKDQLDFLEAITPSTKILERPGLSSVTLPSDDLPVS
jgi:hypothetical protein